MAEEYQIDVTVEARSRGANEVAREMNNVAQATRRTQAATAAASKVNQQASRNYLNLSTAMDGAIKKREREGQVFSQTLRARVQGEAQANREIRNYANISNSVDGLIRAREQEAARFSSAIKSRMQSQVQAERAEARNVAAQKRSITTATQLATANRALDKSLQGLNTTKAADGLDQVGQASLRYRNALQQTQVAQRNLASAQKAGDPRAQAVATRELTSSVNAQSSALRSLQGAQRAAQNGQSGINDLAARYVQYDLAHSLLTVAGAFGAVGVAAAVSFAKQEKAFSAVERILGGGGITGEPVQKLKNDLIDLSEAVPIAFEELAGIADFGAALDIAAADLDEFAFTVARFVSMSGVSAEQAGKSIARIYQYTKDSTNYRAEDKFDQIASAIVRLGNVSIATESEVLAFSQSISPLGAQFGFAAEQVIAMSAATASFASINVEGAGSAFSRVVSIIERSAKSGGDQLQAFADMSGMTAEQFQAMWDEDAGGAFNAVLAGLNKDIPNLVTNLDELGIKNERDKRVIRALAINYKEYARYLDESNKTLQEGTFLSDSYAYVMDDLASQWQVFVNQLSNAGAALGQIVAPALSVVLRLVGDMLTGFRKFAATDFGRVFLSIATAVATLVAGWAALRGSLALVTGGFLAFRSASAFLGGSSITRGIQFLFTGMDSVDKSTSRAANTMGRFKAAGSSVMGLFGGPWGLALTAAATAVTVWATHVSKQAEVARDRIRESFTAASAEAEDILKSLAESQNTDFWGSTAFDGSMFTGMEEAMVGLEAISGRLGEAMSFIDDQSFFKPQKGVRDLASNFGISAKEALSLDKALGRAGEALDGLTGSDAVDGILAFGEAFDASGDELYAFAKSEAPAALESILQLGKDAGLTGSDVQIFNGVLRDSDLAARAAASGTDVGTAAVAAFQEEVDAAKGELEELRQAFLNFETAGKTVAQSQDSLSRSFNTAYTRMTDLIKSGQNLTNVLSRTDDEAIDFRGTLVSLESDARIAADAILRTGGSSKDAAAKYKEGRQAVMDLLDQMGVAPDVAQAWADKMFGPTQEIVDMLGEIENQGSVVNNMEVEPEVGMDSSRFVEGEGSVRVRMDILSRTSTSPKVGMNYDDFNRRRGQVYDALSGMTRHQYNTPVGMATGNFWSQNQDVNNALYYLSGVRVNPSAGLEGDGYAKAWSTKVWLQDINGYYARARTDIDVHYNQYGFPTNQDGIPYGSMLPRYATGGYTGAGGKYEPAGIVHRGEYVIKKEHVDQSTGLPKADVFGKLVKGHETGIGYARGGHVSERADIFSGPIDLSDGSIRKLARALPRELVADGRQIASLTNNRNAQATSRGAR